MLSCYVLCCVFGHDFHFVSEIGKRTGSQTKIIIREGDVRRTGIIRTFCLTGSNKVLFAKKLKLVQDVHQTGHMCRDKSSS